MFKNVAKFHIDEQEGHVVTVLSCLKTSSARPSKN